MDAVAYANFSEKIGGRLKLSGKRWREERFGPNLKAVKISTPWWVRPAVGMALPIVTRWAHEHEERILAEGRPLAEHERAIARAIGVNDVRRVRVLSVPSVPTPGSRYIRALARMTRIATESPAGMALGHGIYLERHYAGSRLIFLHELVHVAQYERLGGIRSFMQRYLTECLAEGYDNAEMEQEANRLAWENYRHPEPDPGESPAGIA